MPKKVNTKNNPATKIIFIQRIIKYSLPNDAPNVPKQLNTYLEVNNDWEKTIIDYPSYFDYVWDLEDKNRNSIWHYATKYIKSDKFWEMIAQKDDDYFQSWKKISYLLFEKSLGRVWVNAIKNIKSNIFWETIIQKDNAFANLWIYNKQINGTNLSNWDLIFENIKSEKFWEIIAQKDDDFFEQFKVNWESVIKNVKTDKFWKIIAQKSTEWFEKNWSNHNVFDSTVWHTAVWKLESEIFWKKMARKNIKCFQNFNQQNWTKNTVWHYAIWNENMVQLFENIAENDIPAFESWNKKNKCGKTVWDFSIGEYGIKSKLFWDSVLTQIDSLNVNKEISEKIFEFVHNL
jgi:hypothetical protein